MSLRKAFKTDKTLEKNGVDVAVGINDHNGQAIYITIRRQGTGNKAYTSALQKAMEPHQSSLATETMDNDLAGQIIRQVFASTVLLGWRNLPKSELTGNDEDTAELDFTKDNAIALFDEMPEMYDDWSARAKKAATFRGAIMEANAGN